jgi:hypothetical protein
VLVDDRAVAAVVLIEGDAVTVDRPIPTITAIWHSLAPRTWAQSENFANIADRRSLGRQRISPRVVTTGDRVRGSIADSENFTPASGSGGCDRNGWPTSIRIGARIAFGIAGRFASDCAARASHAIAKITAVSARTGIGAMDESLV